MNNSVLSRLIYQKNGVPRFSIFPLEEKIFFFKRLSVFLNAGVPILDALEFLREDARSVYSQHVLRAVTISTAAGRPLSESLGDFHKVFGGFSISFIRTGETGGSLAESLQLCSEYLEKKRAIQRKVVGALVYPALVVFATFGITTFLTLYAFPKMLPVLRGFRSALPLSTRILISISAFLGRYWLLTIILFFIAAYAFIYSLRFIWFRKKMHRFLISIPIFGQLLKAYEITVIMQTLRILLRSGIPIAEAIEISEHSAGNLEYREALQTIRQNVVNGLRISDALRALSRLFPSTVTQLIRAGEATGTLPESLVVIEDLYTDEIDDLTHSLTTLIEPMLMIIMGLIVGFIAIAIITPIYSVTQNLGVE